MNGDHPRRDGIHDAEGGVTWEDRPAAGWEEFRQGRERFLALLAAQAATARVYGRLPGANGPRYDSAPVVLGEGARSR